jgi:polyribonucleotide nucleotidyltransferase
MVWREEMELAGRKLTLEVGSVARQAGGSVLARYGDTIVLATATASKEEVEGIDFAPLTVEYRENYYAAGKIPGAFPRREGRPRDKEILVSRLIDRPIRPLFPKGFKREVQVVAVVLSYDQENEPDVLAIIASSLALCVSDIPYRVPVAAVRIGRIGGRFVVNPSFSDMVKSELDLVVAGTKFGITMMEGEAKEVPEEMIIEAVELARDPISSLVSLQERLISSIVGEKAEQMPEEIPEGLKEMVDALARERIRDIIHRFQDKVERRSAYESLKEDVITRISEEFPDMRYKVEELLFDIFKEEARKMVLEEGRRLDGRRPEEIREIKCEVGVLPRAHGSALFTRGRTQALVVTTLGTSEDEMLVDDLEQETTKKFMLHYNFPPFSVGEVRPMRGPGRREIGHGALAERALKAVMPNEDEFPYTVRIVSDILESDGSTSMASVCGGSLSLMDAGVPVRKGVAGIAMGLIKEGDRVVILSDIIGDEDHLGDMDFKVAGTDKGVTAIQMDIKVEDVSPEILRMALQQARDGRLYILDRMKAVLPEPRKSLSPLAPRIVSINIDPEKIGDVIGPGGKVIRKIQETTGTKIEIEPGGRVLIASSDEKSANSAIQMIKSITEDVEVGKTYFGKVTRITSYGAFVEVLPGKEGLVHISQLSDRRVGRVEDVLKEGDEVLVKVIDVDRSGRITLSRKAVLEEMKSSGRSRRPFEQDRRKWR